MKNKSNSVEKKKFCKSLTIITDTREQQNSHILKALDDMGIKHEERKLHFGDYSFRLDSGEDFTLSCIVERKASINEVWGNITTDRQRFEKEIQGLFTLTGSAILLIENCPSREYLRNYAVPAWQMQAQGRKVSGIGGYIDATFRAWESANRYLLQVHCIGKPSETATEILNIFYYYWRNFEEMKKPLKTAV